MLKCAAALFGLCVVFLSMAGAGAWAALAIHYSYLDAALRTMLAWGCAAATLAALGSFLLPRWRWRAVTAFAVLFGITVTWWFTIDPSNDRDWQPDVAVLPHATIDGGRVTVHNIRNFSYRSETDFTPAYYDRAFDVADLEGIDIVASYWMGPAIAHILVSFAFSGGRHLAISIETRKERGEAYSTIRGFFRQYELYYVVADERDVIRVRTNYRRDPPEDVYVYRVRGPIENARRIFLDYMREINSLKAKPEFYNTLTTNCTTNVWMHARMNPERVGFSWKLLASGYVPEYLYENGRLDTSVPFVELQRRSHINARARAADRAEDFSSLIRRPTPPERQVPSRGSP